MVQFESHAKSYIIIIDFEIAEKIDYYNRKIYGSLLRTFHDSKMHLENYVFLYCVSDNIKFALTLRRNTCCVNLSSINSIHKSSIEKIYFKYTYKKHNSNFFLFCQTFILDFLLFRKELDSHKAQVSIFCFF